MSPAGEHLFRRQRDNLPKCFIRASWVLKFSGKGLRRGLSPVGLSSSLAAASVIGAGRTHETTALARPLAQGRDPAPGGNRVESLCPDSVRERDATGGRNAAKRRPLVRG